MTFHRGQKVVYVGAPKGSICRRVISWFHPHESDDLIKGQVYTVECCLMYNCIHIVGHYSPGTDYWCEGYRADAFRPAVERKSDINMLIALLDPTNHKEFEEGAR